MRVRYSLLSSSSNCKRTATALLSSTSRRNLSSNSSATSSFPPLQAKPRDWRAMAEQDITKYLRQTHDSVFEHNKAWAAEQSKKDPSYFAKLSPARVPSIYGLDAATRASPPRSSRAWSRERPLCTATSPTWFATPTSTS